MGSYLWGEEQEGWDEEKRIEYFSRYNRQFNFSTLKKLPNTNELENAIIIPIPALHKVFLYLEPNETLNVALSCRYFHSLFQVEYFWIDYGRTFIDGFDRWMKMEKNEEEEISAKEVFFLNFSTFTGYHRFDNYYKSLFSADYVNYAKLLNESIEPEKMKVKVIIIGAFGVGKTSLLNVFCGYRFEKTIDSYQIGSGHCYRRTCQIKDKNYKLEIWDTNMQERFGGITRSYYRGSSIILLCFDITSENSFHKMIEYHEESVKCCLKPPVYMVCGCKCDLEEKREVSWSMVRHFLRRCKNIYPSDCCETSSKDMKLVNYPFGRSMEKLYSSTT